METNLLMLEYVRLYKNCEIYLQTFQDIVLLLDKKEVSKEEIADLIGEAIAKSIKPPITEEDRKAAERHLAAELREIQEG